MKKFFGVIFLMMILFSCEKLTDKCYVCETRTEVNTIHETSVFYEVTDVVSIAEYERTHSSVVLKNTPAGPYYSQTITKCREK